MATINRIDTLTAGLDSDKAGLLETITKAYDVSNQRVTAFAAETEASMERIEKRTVSIVQELSEMVKDERAAYIPSKRTKLADAPNIKRVREELSSQEA